MKITILEKEPGGEDEIIVKCGQLDEKLMRLINQFKSDDKVFAYTKDCVYETKAKLYQLEEELPVSDFFRANKPVIVNLDKIDSLAPAFGGGFEATLENGYKVVVSRNYLNELKEMLGL